MGSRLKFVFNIPTVQVPLLPLRLRRSTLYQVPPAVPAHQDQCQNINHQSGSFSRKWQLGPQSLTGQKEKLQNRSATPTLSSLKEKGKNEGILLIQ